MFKLPVRPTAGFKAFSVIVLLALFAVVVFSTPVFAEGVSYSDEPDPEAVQRVKSTLQRIATSIRNVLGYTALITLLAAAAVAHFVHEPRAKERAREFVVVALLGLVIAGFAPTLINWIDGLARGLGG